MQACIWTYCCAIAGADLLTRVSALLSGGSKSGERARTGGHIVFGEAPFLEWQAALTINSLGICTDGASYASYRLMIC